MASPRERFAGFALSTVVTLALFADAGTFLFFPEALRSEFEATGLPMANSLALGLIILMCALLYAVPATAFLGAILTTGFLGGAICVHFRLGQIASPPQMVALLLGCASWAALYLRDPRVRSLLSVFS